MIFTYVKGCPEWEYEPETGCIWETKNSRRYVAVSIPELVNFEEDGEGFGLE